MDHIFRRQVVAFCQHSLACGFFIVSPISDALLVHLVAALRPKLYSGRRVYRIVNTSMAWNKTPQHLGVCSIDNSSHLKSGNVSLPDRDFFCKNISAVAAVFYCGNLVQSHDSFFPGIFLKKCILYFLHLSIQMTGHADIH